jgi:energy coupling factor transporter S component ThiW
MEGGLRLKIKKITYAAILIAMGVVAGNVIFIPVGAAKCFPIQSVINVLVAVTLGPSYGVAVAFCISLIRNILGTGTLLAFPGSMIGAFLSAILYRYTDKDWMAVVGEVIGTGIIGALVAFPIATMVLGKHAAVFFYVVPFLISTIGGSIIAYILIKALEKSKLLRINTNKI